MPRGTSLNSAAQAYKRLYHCAMIVTSYSEARAKLASLMDKAVEDAEEIRITRRGSQMWC